MTLYYGLFFGVVMVGQDVSNIIGMQIQEFQRDSGLSVTVATVAAIIALLLNLTFSLGIVVFVVHTISAAWRKWGAPRVRTVGSRLWVKVTNKKDSLSAPSPST